MTAVLIEIQPITPAATDEVEFIDDLEAFGTDAAPGCGDDNPYQ
jgi:hypothetical protein